MSLRESLGLAGARALALAVRALGREPVLIGLQSRIGHLATEPDLYFKDILGQGGRPRPLIVADPENLSNPFLLECWSRLAPVLRSARLYRFVKRHRARLQGFRIVDLNDGTYGRVLSAYRGGPLLSLSEADLERGRELLRRMGLPEGAWHVCVHCRESGYLQKLAYHSYRDADVLRFLPAMRRVVERGGLVFRMGDPSMRPLPPEDGIVDIAHHPLRSDFLDVFLSATCRFFLGTSSGLFCVAGVFGRPVACVNMAPLESLPFYEGNLSIPKLLYSRPLGRLLTFPETFGNGAARAWSAEDFERQGLEVVENESGDILDLAQEMLDLLEGGAPVDPLAEALRSRFHALFREEHTGHSAGGRIGLRFISKYAELLENKA